MKKRHFFILSILLFIIIFLLIPKEKIEELIYGSFRSFLRMFAAYIISILFSYFFGTLIIHNKKAYDFIFPILDVLQAVPILGFFPFAVLFFIDTFPKGILGQELASIFLIWSGMTWSLLFAVIESSSLLTKNIRDLCNLLNIKGVKYLLEIFLPITFPAFVSASITGWGGGWYFLFAAEYMNLGSSPIILPGLGTFIAESAYHNSFIEAIVGLGVMAFIVMTMEIYIWVPLMKRINNPLEGHKNKLINFLEETYTKIKEISEEKLQFLNSIIFSLGIDPKNNAIQEKKNSYLLILFIFILFLYILIFKKPEYLKDFLILKYAIASTIRIVIGLLISLVITIPIALLVSKYKRFIEVTMSILDVLQSIPAIGLFPIIITVMVIKIDKIFPHFGPEAGAIFLLLLGMVWYLLFIMIRALNSIPKNVLELAKLLKMDFITKLKEIYIPTLIPSIVSGSVQSVAGGWNSTIVAEYILNGTGGVFPIIGLGYLLTSSTLAGEKGDFMGSMLAVSAMTLIILITNEFIWKPLLRISEKYRY